MKYYIVQGEIVAAKTPAAAVKAYARRIATESPNLTATQIADQLPTLSGIGTEDDYTSPDAAVEAWAETHPTAPETLAANHAAFMAQVDDAADYSDAADAAWAKTHPASSWKSASNPPGYPDPVFIKSPGGKNIGFFSSEEQRWYCKSFGQFTLFDGAPDFVWLDEDAQE